MLTVTPRVTQQKEEEFPHLDGGGGGGGGGEGGEIHQKEEEFPHLDGGEDTTKRRRVHSP